MSSSDHQLPDHVVEVARRGNFIEAIKLLRAATGMGLKEAKELIDAFKRGDAGASSGKLGVDAILGSALTAMRSGSRPEAIKLLREQLEKIHHPKHATPQKITVERPRHAALQGAHEIPPTTANSSTSSGGFSRCRWLAPLPTTSLERQVRQETIP